MKRSLIMAAILLLTTHVVSMARLGENMEEIEKRYGRRVILPRTPPVCVFQTGPYQIYVIMEDNAAECIIYTKEDGFAFSGQEIQLLMEKNCPGSWRARPRADEEPYTCVSTNGDFSVYTHRPLVLARRSVSDAEKLILVSGHALAKARRDYAIWRRDKRSPLIQVLLEAEVIPRDLITPIEDKNATKDKLDQLGL